MKNDLKTATSNTEMVTISRAEYDALLQKSEGYAELNQKLEWLMEQLRLVKKKTYGSSSEHTREELMDQLSFVFNEAKAWQAAEEKVQETTTVAEHARKNRSSRVEEVLPEDVPVEVVEHYPDEAVQVCPAYGSQMSVIGKEVRRSLVMIPAQVKIWEDVYYTYSCQRCKKESTETPVVKAEKVPAVIPGSYASPEAIAHIMVQKFVMGSPLYRQEQEWNRAGVKLSRQTMSDWILRAAEDWLRPVYDQLHWELVGREVLRADDTTLQVLREPGKSAQSKSYMWLYRTGCDAEHTIVLYEYRPNRKAENAAAFLQGFTGYLHADSYSGYHKLPGNIRVVGCWAHARRKFDEAVAALPKGEQAGCAALEGQRMCNQLFSIEREIAGLPFEERCIQRQSRAKPVLGALLSWAERSKAPPKSALGKAVYYLKEQWPYLIRYLEDGRLEVSNNWAERSIKPFVMDRKNFLFANTPNGAQGSAIIFSLIETAKENGLDPYRYLVHVMTNAPVLEDKGKEWAEKLLPEYAPDECRTYSIQRQKNI